MAYEEKGQVIAGPLSGARYDFLASLGDIKGFYRKVSSQLPLQAGSRVLDLGCGTGSFAVEVAEKIGPSGSYDGVDLSVQQLEHARKKTADLPMPCAFHQCSIDDLPFEAARFDLVVSITTFHHVPSRVRRAAIRETARVLKPGGNFALIDLNRPRWSLGGAAGFLLYLFNGFDPALEDHWKNRFPHLCKEHHLLLTDDTYITEFIRCQVFRKEP